jgi:hypothetical protein
MIESQNKQILRHLQSGKTITALDALRLYGCLRLSGRIYDLRRSGQPIQERTITTLTGKHISEYFMNHETTGN